MDAQTDHTADYKALSFVTKALIGNVLFFSSISILIHLAQDAFITDKDLEKTFFAITLIIAAIVIVAARIIYARRVKSLTELNRSGKEKLYVFRAITITHMALYEMPAILSITVFICFGNFLLFLVVAMALVEMFKKFPTQQRMESAVNSGTF
jgi:hypothetical protein